MLYRVNENVRPNAWRYGYGFQNVNAINQTVAYGPELLVDGDMEAATTAAWIANSGAVLTKETTTPHGGLRCLRVKALLGDAGAQARQDILTIGKTYRFTGWARTDGVADKALVFHGGASVDVATTTAWTKFDFTATAASAQCLLGSRKATADSDYYCEFDNVSVKELVA